MPGTWAISAPASKLRRTSRWVIRSHRSETLRPEAIAGFGCRADGLRGRLSRRSRPGENLRGWLEKLRAQRYLAHVQARVQLALGFGFRCGFLRLLRMEIIQNASTADSTWTSSRRPNVSIIRTTQGGGSSHHNPSGLRNNLKSPRSREPYIWLKSYRQFPGQRAPGSASTSGYREKPDLHHAGSRGG